MDLSVLRFGGDIGPTRACIGGHASMDVWLVRRWQPLASHTGVISWPMDHRMARAVALGTWRADITVVNHRNPTTGFRPLEATPSVTIQRAYLKAIEEGRVSPLRPMPTLSEGGGGAALGGALPDQPGRAPTSGFCKPFAASAMVEVLRFSKHLRQALALSMAVRDSLIVASVWEQDAGYREYLVAQSQKFAEQRGFAPCHHDHAQR